MTSGFSVVHQFSAAAMTMLSQPASLIIHSGYYMSAHVLLNLLNKLRKEIKPEACRAFYCFSD